MNQLEEHYQVFKVQGLTQELDERIKNLYKHYFDDVRNHILKNSGSMEDARDLFQELALVYYKQLQKPDFKIETSEKNYIYGICKNLWLKKLRDRKLVSMPDDNFIETIKDGSQQEIQQNEEKDSLIDLICKTMDQITEECRQIIYLAFYLKKSALEIAGVTGYSEQFIKVKKHRCLQGMRKMIIDSPGYRIMNQ
ncbi:MAG: sigma-70 family RNA polymerase sigma factor [Saprospiraceae bacterium]|nr:sigma-70 family RNA polymerase sigma factor [Saprospiraceae bacterium]